MVEAEPVIEQKQNLVVLIPGGFKPPTHGHFSMIKQYEKRADVSKIIVVTGFKPREEPGLTVTYQQSKAIFDVYGGFGNKVEFRDQGSWPTPMRTCYELMNDGKFVSQFPGAVFALGASDKEGDKDRITAFYNHFQKNPSVTKAEIVDYAAAKAFEVDGEAASATRMRKAFVSGDWETFKKLMHDDSQYDNVVQILNNQGANDNARSSMVAENFLSKDLLFSLVEEQVVLAEEVKEEELEEDVENIESDESQGNLFTQIMDVAKEVIENGKQLAEMSAMGAGAVAGHTGNLKDEQIRSN